MVLPVEGGPGLHDLRELLTGIAQVSDVRGVEICGYDPRQDPAGALTRLLADAIQPVFGPALVAS